MRLHDWIVLLSCVTILGSGRSVAQTSFAPLYWSEADLAFILPEGWTRAEPFRPQGITLSRETSHIDLLILEEVSTDLIRRQTLEGMINARGLMPLQYTVQTHFGQDGLKIDAVDRLRVTLGIGIIALLPDDRALLLVGIAPSGDLLVNAALTFLLDSLTLSASVPPTLPSYGWLWSSSLIDETFVISAWARGRADRLYGLDTTRGVVVFDATDGAYTSLIEFNDPAQATGIAADQNGVVYISDRACRCIRRLNEAGRWLDPIGKFSGGAPHSVAAAPAGIVYAVDGSANAYVLDILTDADETSVNLNFNTATVPLISVDPSGTVWVLEWLRSLMTGEVSAAISVLETAPDENGKQNAELGWRLQFWIDAIHPDGTTGFAVAEDRIVIASRAGSIASFTLQGVPIPAIATAGSLSLVYGQDTLYSFDNAFTLWAWSRRAEPDRYGGQQLADDVPVFGRLTSEIPTQEWAFMGQSGETICLYAADLRRTNAVAIGVDAALRLFAPDGVEIGYNDDHLDSGLFGIYDAALCPTMLPQTGTYRLQVEQRQGDGVYGLVLRRDAPLALGVQNVVQVEGEIRDLAPQERWTFSGRAGQTLTLTMTATSGDLDALLALYDANGTFIASNDDATDTDLGINAQIAQVQLPADGTYTLQAGRWEGTGRYRLIIAVIAS